MTKINRPAIRWFRCANPIWIGLIVLFFTFIGCGVAAAAQASKAERIGVIHLGGVLATVADGLRAGLKELGLEEGKQVVLDVQDLKGEAKSAENVAQKFERDQVKLIFTNTAPVTTAAIKATKNLPIVFAVGTDPVAQGFIQSFARPGGRLTGVQYLLRDLTGKRLEVLKEFLPGLLQILTLVDPSNSVSVEGAKLGREEARRHNIKFIERQVESVAELGAALTSIKARQFDAYLFVPHAIVVSQPNKSSIVPAPRNCRRCFTIKH